MSRKLGYEVDVIGNLVPGDLTAYVLDDLVRRRRGLSDLGREKHAREKIHGDREDHLPHRPRPANKSYPEEAEACRTCDATAQGTCFVDSALTCDQNRMRTTPLDNPGASVRIDSCKPFLRFAPSTPLCWCEYCRHLIVTCSEALAPERRAYQECLTSMVKAIRVHV